MPARQLGTMITCGYPNLTPQSELDLAASIGAELLEILPDWRSFPDVGPLRRAAQDRGLRIRNVHGCWGGQSIKARRVDLGSVDAAIHRESIDDLRRCIDWLEAAGGTHLIIHPGGLSEADERQARRGQLARGLVELAELAAGGGMCLCVENMPPGVHPGSLMADLHDLVRELSHPAIALALDTGHAHISADVVGETLAAGHHLATTHVHDNDGRRDSHDPPGHGTIAWPAWAEALDRIRYEGPIVLECIRQLREDPSRFFHDVIAPLLGRE
ncbi:sugar phosphate isomerase/epimerase family protein [Aquisphaera giovannonii]|uniref:sugar phosphate isomerase/epimerase family protein n=1 Tax=Aquisphaera giovannonii TaxID=406548 RepID=UPI001FE5D82B|nr:sugar phosphate isomerase/epimerase family protein [Aquisphaera giovannonii]